MILNSVAKVLVAINSNRRPAEIAAGMACGLLLGFLPASNLLWPALLVFTLFLKINLGAELLSLALFKLVAPLLDGLFHSLGLAVLSSPALHGLFTALYNMPVVPFTRFNNTVVMGGFLSGLVLWVPSFLLFRMLVRLYRARWRDRLAESRLVRSFQRLPIVSTVIRFGRRLLSLYQHVR